MKVLVACEFTGVVRDAFLRRGHNAWSVDLEPSEGDYLDRHFQADALEVARAEDWDLIIAHPPCTHLSVSGARWFKTKDREQVEAAAFAIQFFDLPHPHVCVENPISVLSRIRRPTQIIQPWQFGHGETKATCLWLKGLPPLVPTYVVEGRNPRIHKMPGGRNQSKERSRTYTGIAEAMAEQWSNL